MKRFLTNLVRRRLTHGFHAFCYCSSGTGRRNTFLGYNTNQLPIDLWHYQEMMFHERPSCIVQTGIAGGGSLLYFANLFDLIGSPPSALVIGVDIALSPEARTISHPRIRLLEGNSVAPESLERVARFCNGLSPLVVLSSDSQREHVLRELELYSPLIPPGGHLVVEKANRNSRPSAFGHRLGPLRAVDAFLDVHMDFARDDELGKRNLFSSHRHGWLVRAMQMQPTKSKEQRRRGLRKFQWAAATKSSV
jgi:cephalosporin hydroxylase